MVRLMPSQALRVFLTSLLLSNTALGGVVNGRQPGPEAYSVAISTPEGSEHLNHHEARGVLAAAVWLGKFALTYMLGGFLDGAPDSGISPADIEQFGDELLEGIKTIVSAEITKFQQERDSLKCHSFLRNVAAYHSIALPGDLSGLQQNDQTLNDYTKEANDILSFLTTPAYSGFAASYYLIIASATLHIYENRVNNTRLLAAAPDARSKGINNTDAIITEMKNHAAASIAKLETHFIPNARKTIDSMFKVKNWRSDHGGAGTRCWVDRETGIDIQLPQGGRKRVWRGDTHKGTSDKSYKLFAGWYCSPEDYDEAYGGWNAYYATRQYSSWKRSAYGHEALLWNSEIGAALMTSEWNNTMAGFRYVQTHGTLNGYVPTQLSIEPCAWVKKWFMVPGVNKTPMPMDVCAPRLLPTPN